MSSFRPAWWIPGPHLQTLWRRLFRTKLRPRWRIERWDTPDGDFVDVARIDAQDAAPDAPRFLLLHGLEGGLQSHYAHATLEELARRGWHATMMLFRSCSHEPNRARRFYHSGETTDLDAAVARLIAEHPGAPIGIAGYSLGGNVVCKWLGERGGDLPAELVGAVAVSVPFDLARGGRRIEQGFSRVYQRFFLASLRRKALAKLERFPDLADRARLERARTLAEFDDCITAPVHGFRDAADYYARSSALRWLDRVRAPMLLLSAIDDPFLPAEVLDEVREVARANPSLELEFTEKGGHVGFIGGRVPWRPHFYAEWRIGEWLDGRLAEKVRHDAARRPERKVAGGGG